MTSDAATASSPAEEPTPDIPAPPDTDAPAEPVAPTDAAGWRALFAALPARELLRVVQKDNPATARILAGFRATPELLRNPIVVSRLVDEAIKQPAFGKAVVEASALTSPASALAPPAPLAQDWARGEFVKLPVTTSDAGSEEASDKSRAGLETPDAVSASPLPQDWARGAGGVRADDKLKTRLKEQKTLLQARNERVRELEAALVQAERERDAARAQTETAQSAQKTAEADADRQKKQREREQRRTAAKSALSPPASPAKTAPVPVPVPVSPSPLATQIWENAVQRLLNRGRYAPVADLCREALQIAETESGGTAAVRGRVHAFYAAAFYGQNDGPSGEEHDRLAANALLDGGEIVLAGETMARLFMQAATVKNADGVILRRLFALAEKMGQVEAVRDVFTRMRITAPDSYRKLQAALGVTPSGQNAGRKASATLLSAFSAPTDTGRTMGIGPDEAVALPTTNQGIATVTPRRLVQAVDANDAGYVARVRDALLVLREQNSQSAALADALLESVAGLDAVAVAPLMQKFTNPVIVDASNVARYNPDPLTLSPTPRVANLRLMRDFLLRRSFFPAYFIADANLRFHVDDRAGYLNLIERGIVRETPPGTSADETLIAEARERSAPLVTNDRLAEWGDAARRLERVGFLISGQTVSLTPF